MAFLFSAVPGRVLFMAANYFLSSAPGQACAWRVRPHFGLEEKKKEKEVEEDRGQGKREEC